MVRALKSDAEEQRVRIIDREFGAEGFDLAAGESRRLVIDLKEAGSRGSPCDPPKHGGHAASDERKIPVLIDRRTYGNAELVRQVERALVGRDGHERHATLSVGHAAKREDEANRRERRKSERSGAVKRSAAAGTGRPAWTWA